MRQLQKKIKTGTLNLNQDDPFELFIAATNIRYCYYNETHKILGNTFGMCVLQVRNSYDRAYPYWVPRQKRLGTAAVDNMFELLFSVSRRISKLSLPIS